MSRFSISLDLIGRMSLHEKPLELKPRQPEFAVSQALVAVEGHHWAIEDSFETAKNDEEHIAKSVVRPFEGRSLKLLI
jgi:hypothetical protein